MKYLAQIWTGWRFTYQAFDSVNDDLAKHTARSLNMPQEWSIARITRYWIGDEVYRLPDYQRRSWVEVRNGELGGAA